MTVYTKLLMTHLNISMEVCKNALPCYWSGENVAYTILVSDKHCLKAH